MSDDYYMTVGLSNTRMMVGEATDKGFIWHDVDPENFLGEVTDELELTPDEGPPIRDLDTVLTEAHEAHARAWEATHE